MKKFVDKFYIGFTKTKIAIVAIVAIIYFSLVTFGGASGWQFIWFGIILAAYVILPGLFLAKLLQTKKILPTFTLPLAFLLGSGFFAALYCVCMRLGILLVLRIVPPILALLWLLPWAKERLENYKKKGLQKFQIKPYQWMLILLFAALWLLYTFASVTKNAHPLVVGNVLVNQDFLWNVGNANSFALAFPPQDIRFVGVRLHYHYLTELLAGSLSIVSGISNYNIIGFYMQPFMLAALVICLYKFGRVIWQNSLFKAMLFCFSSFLFTCASLWKALPNGWSVFGNGSVTHLITNINGQTTATIYLCVFGSLLVVAMRKKYDVSMMHYIMMLCAFFLLTFAKGPVAAIVICGLVLTMLIGLFQKSVHWKGFVFGAVALAMFAVIYKVMFSSGANNSMPLSFSGTLEKGYFANILALINHKNAMASKILIPFFWILQSFLIVPAAFPLFVKQGVQAVAHFGKITQEKLFFNAVAVGGFLAYFLFNHPAMSQAYFLFVGIFFMYILAVDQVDTLRWPKAGSLSKMKTILQKAWTIFVAFFALVGFVTTAFFYINIIGSGARQVARNAGIIEKYVYDAMMTPEDEQAMIWLDENAPEDLLFATNRIHTGIHREGISNLYSALSGRQGYMEGFQYAVTNMGVSQQVVDERLAVNNALFSGASAPEEVARLCEENEITYLIFSTQFDGEETQLAEFPCVFTSETVRIYQVG